MYIVERNEGRLIEARLGSPLTAAEVDGVIQSVRMYVLSQPNKVICVADLSRLETLPEAQVDAFIAMFTRDNAKVERSGMLLGRSTGTAALQINRMIRAAKSPSRQAFDDTESLRLWLEQVLRAAEKVRLREFLAQVEMPASPPSSRASRRPPASR